MTVKFIAVGVVIPSIEIGIQSTKFLLSRSDLQSLRSQINQAIAILEVQEKEVGLIESDPLKFGYLFTKTSDDFLDMD